MTKEGAIELLEDLDGAIEDNHGRDYDEAFRMAIEALQFAEHFDLLKEFQSLQEIVQCKDCRHQTHCHATVAHTERHNDSINCWTEPIEWCSRGERREL
jgi:hypothetical protein